MVFIGLALLLAMNTFLLSIQGIPIDEAFTATEHLKSVQIGFYLWIGSMVVIGLGAIVLFIRDLKLSRK